MIALNLTTPPACDLCHHNDAREGSLLCLPCWEAIARLMEITASAPQPIGKAVGA